MRTGLGLTLLVAALVVGLDAQRRSGGTATLAISVADPSGTPLSDVKVMVEGPASRQTRTERGRVVVEELPAGAYKLRFELEGFVPFERDVTARAGKPIDVKVTLNAAPKPPAPPPPADPPPQPMVKADPAAIDVPGFHERNFSSSDDKTLSLTCAGGASAFMHQLRKPLEEHTHRNFDEFVYVVAGEGTGRVGGTAHKLQAGVLLMVPRSVPHSFTPRDRNRLILLSINAGQPCP